MAVQSRLLLSAGIFLGTLFVGTGVATSGPRRAASAGLNRAVDASRFQAEVEKLDRTARDEERVLGLLERAASAVDDGRYQEAKRTAREAAALRRRLEPPSWVSAWVTAWGIESELAAVYIKLHAVGEHGDLVPYLDESLKHSIAWEWWHAAFEAWEAKDFDGVHRLVAEVRSLDPGDSSLRLIEGYEEGLQELAEDASDSCIAGGAFGLTHCSRKERLAERRRRLEKLKAVFLSPARISFAVASRLTGTAEPQADDESPWEVFNELEGGAANLNAGLDDADEDLSLWRRLQNALLWRAEIWFGGGVLPIYSPNRDIRARELIFEYLRHVPEIWERAWGLEMPDAATPYRVHGGVI